MVTPGGKSPRVGKISLLTLGTASLSVDGQVAESVPANFFRISTYLLLAVQHHSATRQRLWGLLWPDLDQESGSANLRQTLARIRQFQQVGGFELIQSNFSSVFLNPQCEMEWDLREFVEAVEAAAPMPLLEACQLYRGDLLADLPEASRDYEDWLANQRERLRNLFVDRVSEAIGEASLPSSMVVACARHLVSIDPCSEDAYRVLMTDAARKKDPRRLYAIYEKCVHALREEYDVSVSEKTRRHLDELTRTLEAN